ncbi:MAG: tetratricopeptide repeat protein, partial [Alphaproteobacteria bacterium]|nr:tetratricopeptide repeat protein [Alphaproteobacteria bacterium]
VKQEEIDSEALISLLYKDLDKTGSDEIKATILDLGKMAKEGSGEGHRVAASLGQAGSYFKQGQTDEGIKALQALSADTSVKPLYRDFAKLLDIRARIDKDDAQKLLGDLVPLLDAKNPWHISATELSAVLYAKLGQKDKAVEQLNKLLIDPDASSAVVERAKLLGRVYKN